MPNARLVWERHGPHCIYCGGRADTIDHVVPRRFVRKKRRPEWMAMINAPENLVPACAKCNSKKGGRDVRDWLRERPATLARVVEAMARFNPRARELLAPREGG